MERVRAWWLVVPVVLALLVLLFVSYQGLQGQDAYDYLRGSMAWTAWSHGAPAPVMVEHPHGYPLAGALLAPLVGGELNALRLVSALAFVMVVLLVHRVVRSRVPGTAGGVYVLLACGASPFLLRQGLVVMSDVPALALFMASYGATLRWWTSHRWSDLAVAVLLSGLSVCFRLAALPMVAVLAGSWVLGLWRGSRGRVRALFVVGSTAVGMALVVVLWDRIAEGGLLADWSPANWFRSELRSDDGVLRHALPNLAYAFLVPVHPGLLPIGLLVLPFVRPGDLKWPAGAMAGLLALVYLVFVAGMPYQNDRVLLFAQPFVVVALAPAFGRAWSWAQGTRWRPHRIWPLMLVLQLGLGVRAVLPFVRQARVERAVAAELQALGAAHVYTHGLGAALDVLLPEATITELWYGDIATFEPGAYVVVGPGRLDDQWSGLAPATNWDRARRQGLEEVEADLHGWSISRVR